jgi:hypothetical protein
MLRPNRLVAAVAVMLAPVMLLTGTHRSTASRRVTPVTIIIIANDYWFDAPHTLPAGLTTFVLLNRGTVKHEVLLMLLRRGQTIADLKQVHTPEERRNSVESPIGVLFAPPGQESSGQLTATLRPGRTYILACHLRNAVDQPIHFDIGMVDSLYVK